MTLLEQLAGRQLLVVTGKGGVGKSTLAAALGRILHSTGRRVLVLEVDPRESLYPLLGVTPSGGAVVEVRPGLYVQNLQPMRVLDRVVAEQLKIDFLVRRVLASPVYEHFAEGAPGLKELAVLGHVLRVVRGIAGDSYPKIDLVVLDAPATGHGVSMLAAPGLVSDVIRDGPFGHLARELAEFVADPSTCGIAIATLAEEMPVQEAIELVVSVRERLRRRPEVILVNGLYPEAAGTPDDPVHRLWLQRRSVNDLELRRLADVWPGPRIDLPLLPFDRGPRLLDELLALLEPALMERSWG